MSSAAEKDIEEFFEAKPKEADEQRAEEPRMVIYGRVEEVKYQHDLLVKYVLKDSNIVCGEIIPRDILKQSTILPTRVEYDEDSVSLYAAPVAMDNVISQARNREYVQLNVFIDSIHFDHHYLWSDEETAAADLRNEYMAQLLRVHEIAQLERHQLEVDRQPGLKENVRKGRLELERLGDVLNETRIRQGYTATTLSYSPAKTPWEIEDWSSYGTVAKAAKLTPMGKIPKTSRKRIELMKRTSVQLVLYFNDTEVSRTAWIPMSCDVMSAVKRFELELHSPMKSLELLVLEQCSGKVRVLGRGSVPWPCEDDLEIALHEVVFENDAYTNPVGGSFGSDPQRRETGRILCRAILEDGELRLADDRVVVESLPDSKRPSAFELIPSDLVLGTLNQEDDKRRLEELREEDRAQKRFSYRSAVDSRRMSSLQFANLARKRVMDRRRRKQKKYEEIVREESIPTLSVAFSQLFGPADVSRRLKPMRKDERAREEGWDNTIMVNIQSATNLPVRNSGQLQPFAIISYSEKKISTDAAVGRHPNWQFTGKLVVSREERAAEYIEIRVYDQLVEEIDKDDRIQNVVHEQLSARLLASQRIRFETLAAVSKIDCAIRLNVPLYISNYKMPSESCFLKVLISTQIDAASQMEYTRSTSSFESGKTLERCAALEKQLHEQFPRRACRPLVTDLNAHSTVCTRYLKAIMPPETVMQENASNLPRVCKVAAAIVAEIPRVDATSHSDIWGNAFQLTSIAAGGLEERATLLGCWLLYFRLPVAIVLGESRGEKTGFVLTELEDRQVLIDPEDGYIYQVSDSNSGLQNIYGAFDMKNYYANVQIYDRTPQIALNLTKTSNWKPLFAANEEPLESIQPATIRYSKLPEDWIVELRISLEREIKLRFDEARKHAIPQWHLAAARQLREVLENARGVTESAVDEKMARLREGCTTTVTVLRLNYRSMEDCVHEVLSSRLQDAPGQNAQFALAVHIVDFFAHVIQIDVALAILTPKM